MRQEKSTRTKEKDATAMFGRRKTLMPQVLTPEGKKAVCLLHRDRAVNSCDKDRIKVKGSASP